MSKKTTPQPNGKISFVIDGDEITLGALLALEEMTTVAGLIDWFSHWTYYNGQPVNDPVEAAEILKTMTLRQLLGQRQNMLEQFARIQEDAIPN